MFWDWFKRKKEEQSPIEKYDVVYILQNNIRDIEELRYSIRSVVTNFPYNRIVFCGGIPEGLTPDIAIPHTQKGGSTWGKSRSSIAEMVHHDELTEKVWYFNDDFFILKPWTSTEPLCPGTLEGQKKRIEKKTNGIGNVYCLYLKSTADFLKSQGWDTISYESHTPMLIERKLAAKVINFFPGNTAFRSDYGNRYQIGGRLAPDHKIITLDTIPEEGDTYTSTDEQSFKEGAVGEYLRSLFSTPSKYEDTSNEEE